MASFEEIDRRLTRDFNAAVELLQQDEFEKCNDALRNLLADSDISRYYRIRCYTMLAGGLDDFHEAYAFYVKGESLWRLTEAWFRVFPTPAAKQTLDDLRECLEEIREALLNDEQRPETVPLPNVEVDVLRAIGACYDGVEEDLEIAEVEEKAWSENEMSDEDMGGEEEVNDRETKAEIEHKLDDKEESEAQRAGEEQTALQGQKPKGEMVCLKATAVTGVVLTSRRCYHTVRHTYADPIWVETGKSCQRSPEGHMLDRAPKFESTIDADQVRLDNPASLSASRISIPTHNLCKTFL
ncbi:hypothetical protein J4E83_002989 [Alternaria metachromatica]|uniref:uncharacterized protein n=1 Tax=Alternaria metachromatica TaxID=283354 RepID=UPI0020C333A5|nr:uncharacterized protein J4E83_002989 [Alternaria metachromatica]KAI4628439.1 hypothetical protein J4E83_002989 [Alternaria metachromatica]